MVAVDSFVVTLVVLAGVTWFSSAGPLPGPRNLDFERGDGRGGEPMGWDQAEAQPRSGPGFEVTTDRAVVHRGQGAARIRSTARASFGGFGSLTQAVSAAPYRGQRLRLSAFVRTEDVDGSAGLWMRVDGFGGMLAFDNMTARPLSGTSTWERQEVVHDVHESAETIVFGGVLSGTGTVWIDDVELALVGDDVPVTSLTINEPVTLEPPGPEVVDEIKRLAVPLISVEAGNGFADMEPLRELVGDARIVSLGEATHGTREFFQMKHRMLEFLVDQMGFNVFAIEANWPESLAVNEYVLHGTGDPKVALAGMYFWTWNTQEVLALIEWMRAWNADSTHDRKVRFLGYDMQTAQVAVIRVLKYLGEVDPDVAESASEALKKLSVEHERSYRTRSPTEMAATHSVIESLRKRFDSEREAWSEATSTDAWELARQHLEIVFQAERQMRRPSESYALRDRSMAENLAWLVEREGPGTKVVSWAHNGHVSYRGYGSPKAMGTHLKEMFGEDHVNFGFAFERGSFQAREAGGGVLREFEVEAPPSGSVGSVMAATGLPLFVLDMRAIDPVALRTWLAAPRLMRSAGALFSELSASRYFREITLPEEFDALIFVKDTTRARPVSWMGDDPAHTSSK